MTNYDSFSHCHLTGTFFFAIHAGAKELIIFIIYDTKFRTKISFDILQYIVC